PAEVARWHIGQRLVLVSAERDGVGRVHGNPLSCFHATVRGMGGAVLRRLRRIFSTVLRGTLYTPLFLIFCSHSKRGITVEKMRRMRRMRRNHLQRDCWPIRSEIGVSS